MFELRLASTQLAVLERLLYLGVLSFVLIRRNEQPAFARPWELNFRLSSLDPDHSER